MQPQRSNSSELTWHVTVFPQNLLSTVFPVFLYTLHLMPNCTVPSSYPSINNKDSAWCLAGPLHFHFVSMAFYKNHWILYWDWCRGSLNLFQSPIIRQINNVAYSYQVFVLFCFWSGRWVLVPMLWSNLLALSSGSKVIICPWQREDWHCNSYMWNIVH